MIATGKYKGGGKIVDQSKAFPLARTTTLDSKVGATLMMMMGETQDSIKTMAPLRFVLTLPFPV